MNKTDMQESLPRISLTRALECEKLQYSPFLIDDLSTGATSGTGTAYPSGASKCTLGI
jgi:hypothetical protein